MSLVTPIGFNEHNYFEKAWVAGNVSSFKEAKVVVLLENHRHTCSSPFSPHPLVQEHFGSKDVLLMEAPTDTSAELLKAKVKAKFDMDIPSHQMKGWDDKVRWQAWPSYVKIFRELDQIDKEGTEGTIRNEIGRLLKKEIVGLVVREVAMRDLSHLLLTSATEEKKKQLATLISKIKCLALQHFRQSTFPQSQRSLITTISSSCESNKTVWVSAGMGHGDPLNTKFLKEVNRLIHLLNQHKFVILNTTRL